MNTNGQIVVWLIGEFRGKLGTTPFFETSFCCCDANGLTREQVKKFSKTQYGDKCQIIELRAAISFEETKLGKIIDAAIAKSKKICREVR